MHRKYRQLQTLLLLTAYLLMQKAGWFALWSRITCWLVLPGADMIMTRFSIVRALCMGKGARYVSSSIELEI